MHESWLYRKQKVFKVRELGTTGVVATYEQISNLIIEGTIEGIFFNLISHRLCKETAHRL